MKPSFDPAFRAQFRELVLWRRDVRRFRRDPVPRERIDALIEIATHAPSVGLSQPWRFVVVEDATRLGLAVSEAASPRINLSTSSSSTKNTDC